MTAETFAVNCPVDVPAANVIEAGTVTAEFVLDRLTIRPPLGTVVFILTVHMSVPAPDIVVLAQLSLFRIGTPRPKRPMRLAAPFTALLFSVNWPVADPVTDGSNCNVTTAD